MFVLKLFDADEPERLLSSRTLAEGSLTLGRDPGPGGWVLDDAQRLISRAHCVLTVADGALLARDLSSNGLRSGEDQQPLPRDEDTAVKPGSALRLGRYLVKVEWVEPPPAPVVASAPTLIKLAPVAWQDVAAKPRSSAVNDYDSVFSRPVLEAVDVTETTAVVPTDWGAVEPPRQAPAAALPDAALLEAFCAGAKLDLSHFVGEDPQEVMRELGEVYRQMVLGLSDLMSERVTVKANYRMNRTIIRGENNNPFKWAGAQRVAVDLLREPAEGFLRGPAAVNECFADLKKHVLCIMAGLRASVGATLDGLDPAQAKAEKAGLFGGRGGAKDPYRRLHAEFAAAVASDPDGPVTRAFRDAYEKRLRELDGEGAAAGFESEPPARRTA